MKNCGLGNFINHNYAPRDSSNFFDEEEKMRMRNRLGMITMAKKNKQLLREQKSMKMLTNLHKIYSD